MTLPEIDFDAHPAFRGLDVPRGGNDAEAERLCAEIDRERDPARIRSKLEELKRVATAHPQMDEGFRAYVAAAIDRAYGYLLEGRNGPPGATDDPLHRDGFCRIEPDPALARKVWRSTWWERSILRKRAARAPGSRCALALHDFSPGSLAIQRALERRGVLSLAGRYLGCEMGFLYAAIELSHEKQSWYRDCYADAGLPTSQTAYLHFDADRGVMKAMLYLKDVEPANGPFRYVRGSHRWERSPARCALDRGFDAQQTHAFKMVNGGLDYELGYYRPRYKLADFRRSLLMLPRILRGSTHFGDDVVDGSPLSESLLRQEEVLTGKAGTLVLFDGSRGIHRGGQVTRGERWAVQIGLRAVDGRTPRANWKGRLVMKLHYQAQRARGLIAG